MSFDLAKPNVTGRRIATIAVLFIHALKNAVTTENAKIAMRVFPDKRSRSSMPIRSTAPDFSSAPPITNKQAIVNGASFLKTSTILEASTKPSATTKHKIDIANTSGAAHSRMKATRVSAMTARVSAISSVILGEADADPMNSPRRFGKCKFDLQTHRSLRKCSEIILMATDATPADLDKPRNLRRWQNHLCRSPAFGLDLEKGSCPP